MRNIASEFKYDNGYEIPISVMASSWSDKCQYLSQHAYSRPYCTVVILFSIDSEKGAQLYKVDPAGSYMGYKGTSAGEKEQTAANNIEKQMRKYSTLNKEETIKVAIKSLQETLSAEFKPTDIEIAVVSSDIKGVQILSNSEIETELNRIEVDE